MGIEGVESNTLTTTLQLLHSWLCTKYFDLTSSVCNWNIITVWITELSTKKSASVIPTLTTVISSEMVAPSAEVEFIQKVAQQVCVNKYFWLVND